MTPLARSLFLGKADVCDGLESVYDALLECQFFEISNVHPLLSELAWEAAYGETNSSFENIFLPAEPCFIEWSEEGQRTGWLLKRSEKSITGQMVYGYTKGWVSDGGTFSFFSEMQKRPIIHPLEAHSCTPDDEDGAPSSKRIFLYERALLALALGMINTPKVIGRRQHMPDQKLENTLLQRRQTIGRFPLGAWTELLLRVTPTVDLTAEPSNEAHLTGTKAMHFCRAHVRLRLGKIELVRGHWRGDASLGVRRRRYMVTQ